MMDSQPEARPDFLADDYALPPRPPTSKIVLYSIGLGAATLLLILLIYVLLELAGIAPIPTILEPAAWLGTSPYHQAIGLVLILWLICSIAAGLILLALTHQKRGRPLDVEITVPASPETGEEATFHLQGTNCTITSKTAGTRLGIHIAETFTCDSLEINPVD